jgi:hypothetical protein
MLTYNDNVPDFSISYFLLTFLNYEYPNREELKRNINALYEFINSVQAPNAGGQNSGHEVPPDSRGAARFVHG